MASKYQYHYGLEIYKSKTAQQLKLLYMMPIQPYHRNRNRRFTKHGSTEINCETKFCCSRGAPRMIDFNCRCQHQAVERTRKSRLCRRCMLIWHQWKDRTPKIYVYEEIKLIIYRNCDWSTSSTAFTKLLWGHKKPSAPITFSILVGTFVRSTSSILAWFVCYVRPYSYLSQNHDYHSMNSG